MSVALFIITHDELGTTVVHTASETFGQTPLPVATLAVSREGDPDHYRQQARDIVDTIDQGDGVLVITDMFGSTPSNIACSLLDRANIRVVTGLNLPMLIKLFNYPELDLFTLGEKALTGARDGVVELPTRGGTCGAD